MNYPDCVEANGSFCARCTVYQTFSQGKQIVVGLKNIQLQLQAKTTEFIGKTL